MAKYLDANVTWFNFFASGEDFSVYAFTGTEEINRPYEFIIELVNRSSNVDMTSLLGTEASLSIADRSGDFRYVHGIIRHMEQLNTANKFTHYHCHLVPRLWFLDQTRDHRIFQNLSVPQIIEQVLKEQGFTEGAMSFKLCGNYEPREYTVQYGETDLHFISRLCEEEGLYYYFTHDEHHHCLCFCDREGGPAIPGESDLRYYPGSGTLPDTAVISRLSMQHQVNSNKSTYKEYNFTKPKLDLTAQKEEGGEAAPTPPGMDLERYQFPHLYQLKAPGDRYANIQLLRQLTFRRWIECEADVSRFLPSFTFSIHSHPRSEVNDGWWVTKVRHEGKQPEVLEHEAPLERGLEYSSSVTAIPKMTRYVPPLAHPKNRVDGVQSAIVTGPGGEEIYCDEYGRVRVQFHWDREGAFDSSSSCWVRVADTWAGENFGFIQIPRVGQEVLVEYMEGDPDRPVITGRVYNALKMPPWELPSQKTLSGIQSREVEAGRRNQLVLDDTKGEIQTQLSSDHNLSQLNLGYLTRVNHLLGRKDFRGEGFELRTDAWGVVRAGKGLLVSTDTRSNAEKHHKDLPEAVGLLNGAAIQHERTTDLAEVHNAQDSGADGDLTVKALHEQVAEVKGPGQPHLELTAPHMVFSSPAGIALTTPESTHIHSKESTAITAGRHLSVSTGRSFLVSALDKVSLFAHKLGMRLFAAKGKVEIQAQDDDLDVIAEKVLRIISAKETVRVQADSEILLTAGGSYIKINSGGIEEGTPGTWIVRAASRQMSGPASMKPQKVNLPGGGGTGPEEALKQQDSANASAAPVAPRQYTPQELAADENIARELERAWRDSNPNAPEVKDGEPGSLKKEQGGWIIHNPDGSLGVERWPDLPQEYIDQGYEPRATGLSSPMPANAVGAFHTHPNTKAEGYDADPSDTDENFARNNGLPHIIMTHEGQKYRHFPK